MANPVQCPPVYYAKVPACVESFSVKLPGLVPNTQYYYFIEDKFGTVYFKEAATDSEGVFVVSATDFPAGYFNPWIGLLTMEIKRNAMYCEPEIFEVCGQEYHQIGIHFVAGDFPAEIPCICS